MRHFMLKEEWGEMKLNEHDMEKLKRAAFKTVDKGWECYVLNYPENL